MLPIAAVVPSDALLPLAFVVWPVFVIVPPVSVVMLPVALLPLAVAVPPLAIVVPPVCFTLPGQEGSATRGQQVMMMRQPAETMRGRRIKRQHKQQPAGATRGRVGCTTRGRGEAM